MSPTVVSSFAEIDRKMTVVEVVLDMSELMVNCHQKLGCYIGTLLDTVTRNNSVPAEIDADQVGSNSVHDYFVARLSYRRLAREIQRYPNNFKV